MSSLKKDIITGSFWSGGGQLLTMFVTLGTNVVLARLLSPTEFGQVGIIMFFILIANVFARGGLAGALIRKNDADELDYATVFVFNLVISFICYTLLIIFSKKIAVFYNDPAISNLLIVAGLVLPINAFQIMQTTRLVAEMRFKERSLYTFIAICISSTIGILLAFFGVGVWALVLIQILNSLFLTLIYWIYVGSYGCKLRFNKKSFKSLFSFGANTTAATLLNSIFDNIYQLVLGKYFSINQVGLYYQAKKLQDVPGNVINMISQGVLFSALSKVQDDKAIFVKTYNKIILFFTVCMALMTIIIYVFSDVIILTLYGSNWLGAVFYMKVLSIASFFYLQETVNRIIFKVFDRTKQLLNLELLKKSIQSVSIIIGVVSLDLTVLLVGFVITNFISCLINYYYSRKITESVNRFELITLLKISAISTLLILAGEFSLKYLNLIGFYTLWIFPIIILFYFMCLRVLKVFSVFHEISTIKKIMKT